jgi:flavodoxin
MNVLILCDSKFGNTLRLAESMTAALDDTHSVTLRSADEGLGPVSGVDVLLVGGPTHAHGASVPLKEALAAIPAGSLRGARVAAFDTRFRMSRILTGSAAASASKVLERAGADVVAPPESFFVTRDNPPVLAPGEIDRAGPWARAVVG